MRLRAIGMQGDRCMGEIGRHVLRGYFDRTSRQDGNATSIQAQCGVGVQPGGDLQEGRPSGIYSKSNKKGTLGIGSFNEVIVFQSVET